MIGEASHDPLRALEGVDPARFDHRAHVRFAWEMLERHPLWTAVAEVSRGLRGLAARHGHAARYHETLTVGYCLLIHERREIGETWETFAARNVDLVAAGRDVLGRHWSAQLLASDRARRTFVLPDLGATGG